LVGVFALAPSAAAKSVPCPTSPHEPCKGPIEVATTYSGFKEGPLSLIKLTLGPSRKIAGETDEYGGTFHEVDQRRVSWHSVPSVEVVAAFILHRPKAGRFIYQPISTSKHSGHVTLTDVRDSNASPLLIVQGRKIAGHSAGQSSKPSHCPFHGVPCLGSLETYYAFNKNTAGATHLLIAHLGPEEPAGTDAAGHELLQRQFQWHTAPDVKIVAAFEVVAPYKHPVRIKRLTTGPHSGRVTFKMPVELTSVGVHRVVDNEIPVLLLEGERTG
jgi:hypothetical protein